LGGRNQEEILCQPRQTVCKTLSQKYPIQKKNTSKKKKEKKKYPIQKRAGREAQVVEYLPSQVCKTLNPKPKPPPKKKKQQRKPTSSLSLFLPFFSMNGNQSSPHILRP
jgi:hypothetical protein